MADDLEEGGEIKVRLSLVADAAALLLKLAGSPRKQGDYLSQVIRAIAEGRIPDPTVATAIETLEQRLAELKSRL